MAYAGSWYDLLDPDEAAVLEHAPPSLHPRALAQLVEPATDPRVPRPTIESHGDYLFAVFLVPVAVPSEDRVYLQEIDLVLTRDSVLTARKTPPGRAPFDPARLRRAAARDTSPGMIAYGIVNEVAEGYLDLFDALDTEIGELEDRVREWPAERIRRRLSQLRGDLQAIRRTLAPTRDAVRRIVDGTIDVEGQEIFDRDVELHFADAHDKLLRAAEALDSARELVTAVREYHQSQIAQEQSDVVKKLTVIASLLLLPTFIVGVYGQNFEHMPELGWRFGYAFSWALIVLSTAGLLGFFRWRRWI